MSTTVFSDLIICIAETTVILYKFVWQVYIQDIISCSGLIYTRGLNNNVLTSTLEIRSKVLGK